MNSLKKIALLNTITSGIDYVTRLGITFVLNPIILLNLGAHIFGVWKILGQLNSYLATGDLRAATSLKWIVSKERSSKTNEELSNIYSVSLYSFLVLLPLYIIIGSVIMYIAPTVTGVTNREDMILVRNTSFVLVLTFIITQFFFLYESLLQAMNLAYKRIGLRSFILLAGGAANIVVLKLGYSIFAMAIVSLFTIIVNGAAMYWIAKKHIVWMKIVKVKSHEIKSFTGLSMQYTLQKLASLVNVSSDVIILGYLVGPKYVTQYTFTMFAMLGIKGIVQMISTAVIPGVGKFYGEGNFEKVFSIRKRLIELKRFLLTICAVLICLFNESFVALWSHDPAQYSSNLDTYLITLVVLFRVIAVVDKSFINISLKIKRQIGVSFVTAILIIILSFALIPLFNVTGLLCALLVSTLLELLLNANILQKELVSFKLLKDLFYSKSFILSNILILIAFYFSDQIFVNNWFELIGYGVAVSLVTFGIYWMLILNKEQRNWTYKSLIESIKK